MRKLFTMMLLAAMVFAFSGCKKSDEEKAEDALENAKESVEDAGKDAKKTMDKVLGD